MHSLSILGRSGGVQMPMVGNPINTHPERNATLGTGTNNGTGTRNGIGIRMKPGPARYHTHTVCFLPVNYHAQRAISKCFSLVRLSWWYGHTPRPRRCLCMCTNWHAPQSGAYIYVATYQRLISMTQCGAVLLNEIVYCNMQTKGPSVRLMDIVYATCRPLQQVRQVR